MREKFVFQWHILHTCNLHCSHCYQDNNIKNLEFESLENIFYQFLNFCEKCNFKPHINFTGGEPFLYKDFSLLLSLCESNNVTFGILTNGTLITKETVNILKRYKNLSFVQISIDGTKDVHDKIRGEGTYEKAFFALKLLRKAHIETMVAFTCHKNNKDELKKVIHEVRKHKVDRFWCDRLIPIGSNKEDILSTQEYKNIIDILAKEQKKKGTIIHTNRALQFCGGGNEIYKCSAGKYLLTVLANGDLLPCRRLPIVLGNVLNDDILDIYEHSFLIKELCKEKIPAECMSCLKAEICRGGAKCLSYAVKGDFNIKDINCYY